MPPGRPAEGVSFRGVRDCVHASAPPGLSFLQGGSTASAAPGPCTPREAARGDPSPARQRGVVGPPTQMRMHVLFHDNCFDGAASAAVFSRFYRERIHTDAKA